MYFSCIITCYNRENTIERTIRSILDQSFQNFEIIIVDDASSDQSIAKIESFGDLRIRLIRNEENGGQNFSLNVGLEAAKYDFLAFLDSDDTWERDYLLEMSKTYQEFPEIGFAYSNLVDGPIWNLEGSEKYADVLNQGYLSSMITITAKKKAVNDIGNFDPRYTICQDDDFCFRLAKIFPFKVIPKQLSRIHGAENSMTKNELKVAEGWAFLFANYKLDIENYCGSKTYAKHMLNVSYQYFKCNKFLIGFYYYLLAIAHFVKPSTNKFQFPVSEFLTDSLRLPKLLYTKIKKTF